MTFHGRKFLAAALLGTSALIAPSLALAETPAPSFITPDQNGVDLTTGLPWVAMEEGGIGSGPGRVAMQRIYAAGAGFVDNWTGGLFTVTSGATTKTYIQIAGINEVFSKSGSTYVNDKADGGTLVTQADNTFLYTATDGTQIHFPQAGFNLQNTACAGADPSTCHVPDWIAAPNGMKFTYSWGTALLCVQPGQPFCQKYEVFKRLAGVASSAGYSFIAAYVTNNAGQGQEPLDDWYKRTTITFNNSANPPPTAPTIAYTYGTNTIDVTDPGNRTWRFSTDTSGRLTGIRRPGSASDNVVYGYDSRGIVNAATTDGITTSYLLFTPLTGPSIMTATDPLGNKSVTTIGTNGRPTSYQDELGHTISYEYDANARLTKVTQPEGNYTQYTYDARGNVTTTTNVAKSGSGLSNIVTSASFDSTCTNVVKCNKPNSTTDAKGNVSDYTYSTAHGGILTVTQPAPTTGAVRPQTRFTYTQVTSASGDLVYMLTNVAACQTLASCTNAADESQIALAYNSNLLPTSSTRKNGTGTVTATNAMTYDPRGNLLTVDGPLSGTGDTWAYKYDAADQMVGAISPDPDGAGSLKNRAVRLCAGAGQRDADDGDQRPQPALDGERHVRRLRRAWQHDDRPGDGEGLQLSEDQQPAQQCHLAVHVFELRCPRPAVAAGNSNGHQLCDRWQRYHRRI
jgi:YD repeat-containing protein